MEIITMDDFLKNPTGKGSASYARRDMTIANLESRYSKLTKKVPIKHCKVFLDKGSYIFHIKIPSEEFFDELFYDVVLQFIPIGNIKKTSNINKYAMKMFSNSPNFTFTYAYVFNKDKNISKFMLEKLNKKCLKQPPKVRNPFASYGFEKSVYFSLMYIMQNNYNSFNYLSKVNKLNNVKKDILKNVEHADKILEKNKELKRLHTKSKKKEKTEKNKETSNNRTTKKLHAKMFKIGGTADRKRQKKKSIKSTLNKK